MAKPDETGSVQLVPSVAELIDCAQRHGTPLNEELIREIVATNDKNRFVLTADGSRIRANQGHSIFAGA